MTFQEAERIIKGFKDLIYPSSLEGTRKANRDREAIDLAIAAIRICEMNQGMMLSTWIHSSNSHQDSNQNQKCKDCYWYSDATVKCCEVDGSDPCDPEAEGCEKFEPKDCN